MVNLNSQVVLRVNANFMRLGWSSAADAFTQLMSEGPDGAPPAKAVDIIYNYDEFGKPIVEPFKYASVQTYDWEGWLNVEPRKGDLDKVVHTSKRIIRVPTIIVCTKYYDMPKKEFKATPSAIRRRDGNKCQYTGVELTNKTFSIDHVVPKSRGGSKNGWENQVSCHKDVNHKKGDKFNHEVGLKLLKKPTQPKPIALCATVTGDHHPDHTHF